MNQESTQLESTGKTEEASKNDKPQIPEGGRNLVLLGVIAVVITLITTFISLKIYHDSGDIYLDRSRPGFLPEKEEVETTEKTDDYAFSDSGKLTPEVLDEYLENLKKEIDRADNFSADPFGVTPLSDVTLGF